MPETNEMTCQERVHAKSNYEAQENHADIVRADLERENESLRTRIAELEKRNSELQGLIDKFHDRCCDD